MQSLPEGFNNRAHRSVQAIKFERGLASFIERTVKRALGAFKN